MILLCGIPSESPLAMVAQAAAARGIEAVTLNQRQTLCTDLTLRIDHGHVTGWLEIEDRGWPLDAFEGIYVRMMDHRELPEIRDEPVNARARQHADRLHDTLCEWLEVSPARVVNRMSAMGSNSSKTYQAGLVRHFGFDTPETLVTSNPAHVEEFRARFDGVIYKSISGVRSIVAPLQERDPRLQRIRWCPVQFQERVRGFDVRVHVIGQDAFATRVHSGATDYRYATDQTGSAASLEPFELSDEIQARCVAMTGEMGLAFSGIDLRFADDGRVVCFEVNPSPGFSYYEANTEQPIAETLAAYLAGAGPELAVRIPGGRTDTSSALEHWSAATAAGPMA